MPLNNQQKFLRFLMLAIALSFFTACLKPNNITSTDLKSFSFSEESSYCDQTFSYGNKVTIQSKAQFQSYLIGPKGLSDLSPPQNVRWAEVEVINSSGLRVQCSHTDDNGSIVLDLPAPAAGQTASFTLMVYSRAQNEKYKVSVLNNPRENRPYVLSTEFTISSSDILIDVHLPVASALKKDQTLSGAFNILDQIYKANEFLRNNSTCDNCESFAVAPKVKIFWSQGLSPYSYYGHADTGISYYSKEDDLAAGILQGLYILGGVQGDSTCADTDHFDNSVILHEYAHFLEHTFAQSDSPGGSHNGNSIIDPRLAWSEGFANFFQAAVQNTAYYRDSIGNAECLNGDTYLAFNLNIETPIFGQDKMAPQTLAGEGIFREVSVSRLLYDFMYTNQTNNGLGLGFAKIWKVFNKLKDSSLNFRNMGLFSSLFKEEVPDPLLFEQVVRGEFQLASEKEYGQNLVPQTAANCVFEIQGVQDSNYFGESYSDQFKSNDFYEFYYDGKTQDLSLDYTGDKPSDLDLYVYEKNYVYNDATTVLKSSHRIYPEQGNKGLESVNLNGLPEGVYLINIRVNTDRLGTKAYYSLSNDGVRLCP